MSDTSTCFNGLRRGSEDFFYESKVIDVLGNFVNKFRDIVKLHARTCCMRFFTVRIAKSLVVIKRCSNSPVDSKDFLIGSIVVNDKKESLVTGW